MVRNHTAKLCTIFFTALFLVFILIPQARAGHFGRVSMSPSPVNFPDTDVGDTSPVQTVTVTIRPGTNVVNLEKGELTNNTDFSITQDNCAGVQLRQSGPQSCTIDVTFSPTREVNFIVNLYILANGNQIENSDILIGQGVAPEVDLDPDDLDFGEHEVGTTTPPVDVIVTNIGTGDLNVSMVEITSGASVFAIDSEDCTTGSPIVPNAFCTISLTFTPDALGGFNGALTLTDNAGNSPQTVNLSGTGVSPGEAGLSVNPPLLDFGLQEEGTTSSPLSLTITNTGSVIVTNISAMDVSDYSVVSGGSCPAFPFSLTVASPSCTLNVEFSPSTTGDINAMLTITSNEVADLMVELEGVGFIPGSAVSSLSANDIDFGSIQQGNTAGPQVVTVTNTGMAPLSFSGIVLGGDDSHVYTVSDGCSGNVIDIGESCIIEVFFTPTSAGGFNAIITLTSNASNSPQTVTVTGTGIGMSVSGSGCTLSSAPVSQPWLGWMVIAAMALLSVPAIIRR